MRSSDDSVAPIIIKRKKIIYSSTHHGGAWKVAYADFVTAMMAFFMLMWLLNATTEKQRKGLADYFSPTISINRISGGGREMFGGESVLANESLPHQGTGMTSFQTIKSLGIQGISGLQSGAQNSKAEQSRLQRVQDKFMGQTGESSIDDRILKHVIARITDVGLIIDIYDQANSALFDELKLPTNTLKYLLDLFIEAAPLVTNDIAISIPESAERAELVVKNEAGSVVFRKPISNETTEYSWTGEDAAGKIAKSGAYQFFIETFKKDVSQGETEMAAYQNVKEVQFEEGQFSIIFSGGLMADPKTISAVRD